MIVRVCLIVFQVIKLRAIKVYLLIMFMIGNFGHNPKPNSEFIVMVLITKDDFKDSRVYVLRQEKSCQLTLLV